MSTQQKLPTGGLTNSDMIRPPWDEDWSRWGHRQPPGSESAGAHQIDESRFLMYRSVEQRSREENSVMAESVYKVIELVGTSKESWEKAAAAAISLASRSLRDLRVAEV